jgi:hypothetical protein
MALWRKPPTRENALRHVQRHQEFMRKALLRDAAKARSRAERHDIYLTLRDARGKYRAIYLELKSIQRPENEIGAISGTKVFEITSEWMRLSSAYSVKPPSPPPLAEFALHLLIGAKAREGLVGDLAERFSHNVTLLGARRAKRLYWAESIRSLAPLIWRLMKRAGVWALLYAALRRLTG